jgi:hypothetical protein
MDKSLNISYILNNCNNAIIYDFRTAYLKPRFQIRVPHLHKAMSPNVTVDTVDRGSLVEHLSPMRKILKHVAPACIANRIKPILKNIISETQKGFLKDRYIGECTRLIYELIDKLETENLPLSRLSFKHFTRGILTSFQKKL